MYQRSHRVWFLICLALPFACSADEAAGTLPDTALVEDTAVEQDVVEDTAVEQDVVEDTAAPDAPTPDVPAGADVLEDTTSDVRTGPPTPDPNFAVAANGWYRGDLHAHTTHSDGEDDVATVLAIADAYRDPLLLEHHPELAGNGLDFFAITDHRTVAHIHDPDYHHDHLILIDGEEFGGAGHANIWGLHDHIPHQHGQGQSRNERQREAVAEAHGQGALFSVNHPVGGINWVFDTPDLDAIEVWNGPWASFGRGTTIHELDQDVAGSAVENPFIRDAATNSGGGTNEMGLRFWYGHLTAGIHVPVVGGSDRHLVLPIGVPTTYVRKPDNPDYAGLEGKELGSEGILDGLRAGGTFVSHSPWGPQVDLRAEAGDGKSFPLGAELPGPGTYTVHAKVTRAAGGLLRLVGGPLKAPSGGAVAPEPAVLLEEAVDGDWYETSYEWEVPDAGGWLHAIVLEQLVPEPLPTEVEDALETIQNVGGETRGEWVQQLAPALLPLVDGDLMAGKGNCDPSTWKPWRLWCMPADTTRLATFYIPPLLNRLMQAFEQDDAPTDWAMGALTSAFLARP